MGNSLIIALALCRKVFYPEFQGFLVIVLLRFGIWFALIFSCFDQSIIYEYLKIISLFCFLLLMPVRYSNYLIRDKILFIFGFASLLGAFVIYNADLKYIANQISFAIFFIVASFNRSGLLSLLRRDVRVLFFTTSLFVFAQIYSFFYFDDAFRSDNFRSFALNQNKLGIWNACLIAIIAYCYCVGIIKNKWTFSNLGSWLLVVLLFTFLLMTTNAFSTISLLVFIAVLWFKKPIVQIILPVSLLVATSWVLISDVQLYKLIQTPRWAILFEAVNSDRLWNVFGPIFEDVVSVSSLTDSVLVHHFHNGFLFWLNSFGLLLFVIICFASFGFCFIRALKYNRDRLYIFAFLGFCVVQMFGNSTIVNSASLPALMVLGMFSSQLPRG